MTDRELLELAAKAAGIMCEIEQFSNGRCIGTNQYGEIVFDPLIDDGDALRLAVKLGISPIQQVADSVCSAYWTDVACCNVAYRDDPYAATRRAIVRAAAEIGRSMK